MPVAAVSGSLPAGAFGAAGAMMAKETVAHVDNNEATGAIHNGEIKRRDILQARRGLPLQARASAWTWLSESNAKRSSAQLGFLQLACCDHVPDETLYAIEEDCRTMSTFSTNPLFSTTRGVDALSRLLMAFYQRNPQSGYVRGHTARLAALLLVVHGVRNLQNAFWNFCALVEGRMYGECGGQILLGSRVEQRVFERLVLKKLPVIADHLSKLSLPLSTLTQGWFSSCFVSVLPTETAARIMDSVMAEGSKVMHRVALALLKRHASAIVSCARGDCLRKVLEGRMARATEVDELMQIAFNDVGSLPSALLQSFREVEVKVLEAELAKAKQGADLHGTWVGVSSVYLPSTRSGSSRSLASARSASSSGRSE